MTALECAAELQPWRALDKAAWNVRLSTTEASYLGLSGMITPTALRRRVIGIIVREAGAASGANVVAQAAIALDSSGGTFLDALAMMPGHERDWSSAMAALLAKLPAGSYTYGSRWNTEAQRDADFAALSGVTVIASEPYMSDVIDMSGVADPEAYNRVVSKHHRRHLKSALSLGSRVRIDRREGRAGLGLVKPVTALRRATYDNKSLDFSSLRSAAGLVVKIAGLGANARTSVIFRDDEAMGCYFGAAVGRSGYYIHGGNRRSNEGLAHALMLRHIEEFIGTPGGRFVMGFASGHDADGVEVDGHRRFRFGFGAVPRRGSVVRFRLGAA